MGHSLGEYGALVASGALTFDAALEAVSARGREMTNVSQADNGAMAAVFGPLSEIERIVAEVDGYVVMANINSNTQAVVGGATTAVEAAVDRIPGRRDDCHAHPGQPRVPHRDRGRASGAAEGRAAPPAGSRPAACPIVANVTGEFYPTVGHRDDARDPRPADRLSRSSSSRA